jgi:hypothetical protein
MGLNNLQITFSLDGTGIVYNELIHLDSLLAYASLSENDSLYTITSNDIPKEFNLPLDKWYIREHWGWKASVLFPDHVNNETLQFFRRKFNDDRIMITEGSCNLQGGYYKLRNLPESLILINKLAAYCRGDKVEIEKLLKHIKYLGKRRNVGKGKIINIEIKEIENDFSLIKDGCAIRYLPYNNGIRLVRIRPPYWHRHDRINCCNIGDNYEI